VFAAFSAASWESAGPIVITQASRAEVTVRYGAEDLELEVRDDGVGTSSSDGLGHGLVGIQERVKIYGGEMSAGAGSKGGFVLTARLPLEGQRA